MLSKFDVIGLTLTGAVSGFLAFILIYFYSVAFPQDLENMPSPKVATPIITEPISMLTPGIVFGVIVGLYFYFTLKNGKTPVSTKNLLSFIVWMIVSCYIAWEVAVYTSLLTGYFNVFIGGAVGAGLVYIFFQSTIVKFHSTKIVMPIIVGGLLGITFWIGNLVHVPFLQPRSSSEWNDLLPLFFLLIFWQSGFAGLLAFIVVKEYVGTPVSVKDETTT